jgi:two-component system chemotaxis response regulator CheY
LKSCLLLDDSRVVRKVTRRILEGLGFEVSEAADEAEAARAWDTAKPDLVMVEWRLPGADSAGVLRGLRALPGADQTRIVVCSGETGIWRIREALEAGADEYIMKPFDGAIVAGKLASLGLAA